MEKLIYALLTAVMLFLGVLLSTLMGTFIGWVVGWFFGKTILGILAAIGISGFKMWQIGAFLGFVSGFFRTSVSFNRRKTAA